MPIPSSFLLKTALNNLNNQVNLLVCHLIIRRQAQSSVENIRPDIDGVIRGQYKYLEEHIAQKKAVYER